MPNARRPIRNAIAASLILLTAGAAWSQGTAPAAKPAAPLVNPKLPKDVQASQLSELADQAAAKGKLPDAAKLLQQAAELTPDDWALWVKTGWAHLDASQAAPALKAFEAGAKLAPKGNAPSGGLLISYFVLGNAPAASAILKQLLPPDTLTTAEAVVAKGIAAKQFTPDWSYALGYLYARVLRSSARALGPLEAVVKTQTTHPGAWLLLVEVNRDLERGPQEDAAALQFLQLAPDVPDAFRIKAERYAAAQDFPGAIGEYEAGIAKHPTAADLYFQLARVHERTRNPKGAEATYRKLITAADARKLEAVSLQAKTQLANLQARWKNYVEAEKFYREAAARKDATLGTHENWAALLGLTGKWEEAAKAMTTVVGRTETELSPDDLFMARYREAATYLAAGQREPAKSALDKALGSKVNRSAVYAEAAAFQAWLAGGTDLPPLLAYTKGDERWAALVWRRQPEEGEFEVRGRFSIPDSAWRETLRAVQKRYTDCWAVDYALARLYAGEGHSQEALTLLGRAAKARTGWWAGYYGIGQYYARERDKENGIPALRKTLELAPECRAARTFLSLLSVVKDDDSKP
jgi:tetratricopeptide (TPR) repeat protein